MSAKSFTTHRVAPISREHDVIIRPGDERPRTLAPAEIDHLPAKRHEGELVRWLARWRQLAGAQFDADQCKHRDSPSDRAQRIERYRKRADRMLPIFDEDDE